VLRSEKASYCTDECRLAHKRERERARSRKRVYVHDDDAAPATTNGTTTAVELATALARVPGVRLVRAQLGEEIIEAEIGEQ
jgi:hypothetical protein